MQSPEYKEFKASGEALAKALAEVRTRSGDRAAELRVDPEMLLPEEMAERLGISVFQLVNLKTDKKILALGGTDSLLYPAWQLGDDSRLLPGLDKVIAEFEYNAAWRAAHFLLARDRHYLRMIAAGEADEVAAIARSWNHGML